MIRAELVGDADLEELRSAWSALADSTGRPFSTPGWMIAWWRRVAPQGALLRTVAVSENDELIGIAPLYRVPHSRGPLRYRVLGSGTSLRVEPLARAGRESEVARAVANALRDADDTPGLISFEGIPAGSAWPALFSRAWTEGKASKLFREWAIPAPVLSLEGRSFDDWFSQKSSNFRQQMRRAGRKLEAQGGVFRMSRDPDELARDLGSFANLHHARWDERGGSQALGPEVEAMLLDAGKTMLAGDDNFRLWSLEIDGQIASSHLFLAAGGEVAYWLGGFDERWAAQKPSMQVLLVAIRHAWESGDKRVDLGGGGQDYKYRFTDDREMLEWSTIVPPGFRHQATRVGLGTVRARRRLVSKLSPRTQARLRKLVRR